MDSLLTYRLFIFLMQLKTFLETKLGIAVELVLFFTIALSTLQLGIVIPILIVIAIGSLKTREIKYRDLGFIKTDFKLKNILIGIGVAVFYFGLFYFIDPFISKFTSGNLPSVFGIKSDIPKLIIELLITWTIAAFGEEILFRGYLINRLIDLIGDSLQAKILIVLLVGTAFGFVHYYQGTHGVVVAGIVGVFQSVIYLIHHKKLVIPIIAHGMFDSIGFLTLFFA